ncbi:MAG: FtsW/RodA/SpoVE family cell cycle protein [Lachnospiraceae bacterium]|nr:FtsW/RodA/SpoVE family cell cycle protein [Lachnospiraceae bacterium]
MIRIGRIGIEKYNGEERNRNVETDHDKGSSKDVEQYIHTVTGQMRSKRAQTAIAQELRDHIGCQTAEYMAKGMNEEEAAKQAVEDMGDPVAVGAQLDQVHRPRPAWRMLALIMILSILSNYLWSAAGMMNLMPTVVGLAAMVIVYLVDYSFLAGRGERLASAFLILYVLGALCFPITIRGKMLWIGINELHFSLEQLAYLYLPIYGAIVYDHRKESCKGVMKCILWALPMPYLLLRLPDTSDALWIFLACMIVVSAAIGRGWFLVKRKRLLAALWGVLAVAVAGLLAVVWQPGQSLLTDYQKARIEGYLNRDREQINYMQMTAMQLLKSSRLLGESRLENGSVGGISYDVATMRSDFAISLLSARCGKAAVAVAVVLLAALIVVIFQIALRQSNELGAIVGCSVGMVLGIQTFVYLLNNMGCIPCMSGYLPLLSYGGSGAVVSYILLGLVLSVYRYRDIPLVEKEKGIMEIKA